MFYETSAKTGSYVAEAMVGMARYVSACFLVCDVNRCNFIVQCAAYVKKSIIHAVGMQLT